MILELDFETTALDERRGGITQIGARWFCDHGQQRGEFFRRCRPSAICLFEDKALEINGETREQILDPERLPEGQAIVQLLGFIRGGLENCDVKVEIAAWNAQFEMRHFRAACLRAGVDEQYWGIRHSVIDPHSILVADIIRGQMRSIPDPHPALWGKLVLNSDHAADLLGIAREEKPHNALNGARQVHKMLLALGFKQPAPECSDPVTADFLKGLETLHREVI